MKILIMMGYSDEEKQHFINIFEFLKVPYEFGNLSQVKYFDIIFCKQDLINTNDYPLQTFIFGPDYKNLKKPNNEIFMSINNFNKTNCLFLFTRNWIKQEWEGLNHVITGTLFNFPLEVQKYKAKKKMEERTQCIVYYDNSRDKKDLLTLFRFLARRNTNYMYVDYNKDIKDCGDYNEIFEEGSYVIALTGKGSSEFLYNAMSSNLPVFYWDQKYMDENVHFKKLKTMNTIDVWDEENCGVRITGGNELEKGFLKFITNLAKYKPRKVMLENFTNIVCAKKLKNIIIQMEKQVSDNFGNLMTD